MIDKTTELTRASGSESDATGQFRQWLSALEASLNADDADAAAALFDGDECYWRDLVAFTWNIATMEGRPVIAEMLHAQLKSALPVGFAPYGEAKIVGEVCEGRFDFETRLARGKGHARLRNGKCWTLLTAITELKGHEEPSGRRRPVGVVHKADRNRVTWLEQRQREERALGFDVQPDCLVIGAGQGGLALGARLKRLGVSTLIVDRYARAGESWRERYKSLYLHDAVWSDHLPYLPFPDHWPVFMSKDQIADWLEMYARIMELNFWGSTECRAASYDAAERRWAVTVEREGKQFVLRPRHLVLATGIAGRAQVPAFPGADAFEGIQYHSSRHRNSDGLAGKHVVVVGANNSAHDICVDLWIGGADVTMIQRSPTIVIKASTMRRNGDAGLYSERAGEEGITTEQADLTAASMPYRLRVAVDRNNCARIAGEEAEFYERLAASGFQHRFGADGTGIATIYMRRASGYYIDVGASDLIIDGEIKVRSGVGVASIRPRSVVLTDGSELKADVIVYATGFGPLENLVGELVSAECQARVGRCWGLGSDTALDPGPWEGELRNMWKPTAQDGLWIQGGNLAQSRFHSLHLALQIKAALEGITPSVYKPAPIDRAVP